jgi:glycosyltransferase involved in cell wall biosynthesis
MVAERVRASMIEGLMTGQSSPTVVQTADARLAPGVPTVSVIIPTYNRTTYLGQTLDSLRAQTYRDFEVIVIDDGSTDNTAAFIRSRPETIRYFWQENAGPAAARNHGLREARGRFVAFLDSDDLWEPRFLEATTACLLGDPQIDVAFCRCVTIDDDGHVLRNHGKRSAVGGDITAPLFASTFISTPTVLARLPVIREENGFDPLLPTNEDYDLWLRLSLRHRFGLVDERLCLRRSHPGTQSRNGLPVVATIRKARLLERFYRRLGGSAKIPKRLAHRRLAKVYYTAGKSSLQAHRYAAACGLFRQSLSYRRIAPKVWFWYFRAARLQDGATDRSAEHLKGLDQLPS